MSKFDETTDQSVQRRGFSASGTPRQMKQQNNSPCFPDNDLSRTTSHEDDMGPNMSTRPSTPTPEPTYPFKTGGVAVYTNPVAEINRVDILWLSRILNYYN
jgi:hypothetical protein